MIIIIASGVCILLSFVIQVTKLSSSKKLAFLDIFLLVIGSMAAYSEYQQQNRSTSQLIELKFQSKYSERPDPDTLSKNQITFTPQLTLLQSIPKDGVSTFMRSLVGQWVNDGQKGIYLELVSEIQSYEQALQLFGTNNLYELVQYAQLQPLLIVVDNLHLSISNKQCHICNILRDLHKTNKSIIYATTKDSAYIPFFIDEYTQVYLNIRQYIPQGGVHYRYDWAQEATNQQKQYNQISSQKQLDLIKSFNEDERQTLKTIYSYMCSVKCENQVININQISVNFNVLKSLIDKNVLLVRLGTLVFYDQFVFESIKSSNII
ncbi:hypothetical protein pb186bvf_009843 [Paramecium bursaria]